MEVVMRAVGSIKPYLNNPRDNDDAVEAVAASLRATAGVSRSWWTKRT